MFVCTIAYFSCDWELFTKEELLLALIFLSKFGMHEELTFKVFLLKIFLSGCPGVKDSFKRSVSQLVSVSCT